MQQNLSVQYLIGQIRKQGCLSVDCSFLSSQRSHHPSCAACEYVMGFSSLLWMWLVVNLKRTWRDELTECPQFTRETAVRTNGLSNLSINVQNACEFGVHGSVFSLLILNWLCWFSFHVYFIVSGPCQKP